MSLAGTVDLDEAAHRTWHVVVVGAGPAGALAAHQLARRGLKVLLVDAERFPRWKVCGCCLNGRSLAALASAGLQDLVWHRGATPLDRMHLSAKGRSASLPFSAGAALSRESFDQAVVEAALAAGADFLPETRADHATGGNEPGKRTLRLQHGNMQTHVQARLVVSADGLNGRLMRDGSLVGPTVATGSRIGAGAIAAEVPDFYQPGTIFMACAAGGYVGLVRREDARLTVAAAFDAEKVRRAGGLGKTAQEILNETGWPPLPGLATLPWRGTPALTRSGLPIARERLFALGDATGYVEPFTGEGMAWALTAALAIAPLAVQAVEAWHPTLIEEWTRAHGCVVVRRQFLCRALAWTLRSPGLTQCLLRVLSGAPWLARPFLHYLNRPAFSLPAFGKASTS